MNLCWDWLQKQFYFVLLATKDFLMFPVHILIEVLKLFYVFKRTNIVKLQIADNLRKTKYEKPMSLLFSDCTSHRSTIWNSILHKFYTFYCHHHIIMKNNCSCNCVANTVKLVWLPPECIVNMRKRAAGKFGADFNMLADSSVKQ